MFSQNVFAIEYEIRCTSWNSLNRLQACISDPDTPPIRRRGNSFLKVFHVGSSPTLYLGRFLVVLLRRHSVYGKEWVLMKPPYLVLT